MLDIAIKNEFEQEIKDVSKKLGNQIIFLEKKRDSYISKEYELHFSKATRSNIENKQKPYHFGAEYLEEKDSVHHRRSGMNQVHMKLMKEHKKTLVIATEPLIESQEKPLIIGRIKQNLKLAKKYSVPVIICSMATKPGSLRQAQELKSFIKSLGYEDIAKKAVSFKLK
ncbi:MAG: hypothetical protein ACMXX9_02015 [Candidatus Woesearchaeota archaeon]